MLFRSFVSKERNLGKVAEWSKAPHSDERGEKRTLGASQDSLRTFVSEYETKDPMSGQRL